MNTKNIPPIVPPYATLAVMTWFSHLLTEEIYDSKHQ